jgi:thiamine-monophosphate kinase
LSDIAAMGGTPRYALISLAASKHASRAWIEGFFQGLLALAKRCGVAVIGGDTAVVRGASTIDVVVAGEVPRGKALRRSGARPGDQVYVSGRLGLAALGLRLLHSPARGRRVGAHGRPVPIYRDAPLPFVQPRAPGRSSTEAAAIRAQLFPQPQCALGRFLSEQGLATALIDVSDGLSIDLMRLCEASDVGACLFRDRVPSPPLTDAAASLELALHGGEDYQLLFTVSPTKRSQLPRRLGRIPLHCIGEIRASRGIQLITPDGKTRALEPRGYDHFARR